MIVAYFMHMDEENPFASKPRLTYDDDYPIEEVNPVSKPKVAHELRVEQVSVFSSEHEVGRKPKVIDYDYESDGEGGNVIFRGVIPEGMPEKPLPTRSCEYCTRSFNVESIDKHESICAKIKVRPKFDTVAHRLEGLEQGKAVMAKLKQHQKVDVEKKIAKQPAWRDKSNQLRASLMAFRATDPEEKRMAEEQLAKVAEALLTQCPCCGRRFNQDAAERHIPICKGNAKIIPRNKPIPPAPVPRQEPPQRQSYGIQYNVRPSDAPLRALPNVAVRDVFGTRLNSGVGSIIPTPVSRFEDAPIVQERRTLKQNVRQPIVVPPIHQTRGLHLEDSPIRAPERKYAPLVAPKVEQRPVYVSPVAERPFYRPLVPVSSQVGHPIFSPERPARVILPPVRPLSSPSRLLEVQQVPYQPRYNPLQAPRPYVPDAQQVYQPKYNPMQYVIDKPVNSQHRAQPTKVPPIAKLAHDNTMHSRAHGPQMGPKINGVRSKSYAVRDDLLEGPNRYNNRSSSILARVASSGYNPQLTMSAAMKQKL